MVQKRPFRDGKGDFKKHKRRKHVVSEGSNEEVLLADVKELCLGSRTSGQNQTAQILPECPSELDLTISRLSSTGDGLAEKDGRVYVVPFAVPGDTVTARVYKHFHDEAYSLTDLIKVVQASQDRTETPECPYFTKCSGCQFQQLSYPYQLAHKKTVVEKAYRNFSRLPPSAVPAVRDTVGSPLVYGYRTKLTPHFDGPPSGRRDKRKGLKVTWPAVPPIGFMQKGTRKTLDIEDCPIGTAAVRDGLKRERARVAEQIDSYQRGATILLREHTERVSRESSADADGGGPSEEQSGRDRPDGRHELRKSCVSDANATATEYVDGFRFDNPAGAFFQNNNAILPLVTQYIRDEVLAPPITNLIDAYCGSGFFTVALSGLCARSIGIDISPQSIASARRNATLNRLPAAPATEFLAADATALFAAVDRHLFRPDHTVVIIDPPRKGCDRAFLRQLRAVGPHSICYVSCNVHTQARDVGWLVQGGTDGDDASDEQADADDNGRARYAIESVRGFDFFPQTSHVESVAVLRRVDTVRDPSPSTHGDGGAAVE